MTSTQISDEELRTQLLSLYTSPEQIPPVVDATRSLLISKVSKSKLACGKELEITSRPLGAVKVETEFKTFKTLVFFDLEATGLPSDTVNPRITEIHLKALQTDHFMSLKDVLHLYK